MKVLCIGHSSYDITLLVNEFPKENKKIRLENPVIECGGGCASNASVLLSRWGLNTYIASTIGNDYYGENIEKEFFENKVNTKYLQIGNYKTNVSYIVTNTSLGTRTILTSVDKKVDLDLEMKDDFDYILTDGDNYNATYNIINNSNAISILDAGKVTDNILKLCEVVNYIICSNDFARDYSKIDFSYDDIETLKKVYDIIQKDFNGTLIITLESYGSFIKIDDEYYLVSSVKVKAVDSTGAGDIYHGAFLYFISQGYSVLDAMKYSNITGAISVTRIGGRNSIPTLEEVLNYDEYVK